MTHTYQITGMTCTSCEEKIKSALLALEHVSTADVSKTDKSVTITMNKHIPIAVLQNALDPKYQILNTYHSEALEQTKSWVKTYRPILLIFGFITSVTLGIQLKNQHFDYMQWMQHFMAGFFLVFSFFKFLNLKGFAETYRMYDIIAKKIPFWAYIYVFVELALGFAYLTNFSPFLTNSITFVIMSVSIIGVLQTVLNRQKIQCACLGTIFDLPMSSITIIEDALMIIMSLAMLLLIP
ncbi:heavy-metal-associated domain-containing protein [Riemerella anatipestifer]|uniref:heavy-metal-associated domain-containing protein n=1 Tax=Riemerella anatipestifer TaxID=34085 RepID=UPI000D68701E|nr:heavy metal-associated domain-containing protein [Riemerella anatipestifer]MBT0551001.1 cation transporter [Riemerella anatipestifer]MBT0553155.1 cation transporter [Riemerella anatipestifer]MCE3023849.1 cation transporter [Riemerella anatipestifer]MCU7541716.1 cation transporter [Riemerella anatipestifer]MCU7559498.1 cation transporter [Riemerella anatipestifer]